MILSNKNMNVIIEKVQNVPESVNSSCVFDFKNYQNEDLFSILHIKFLNANSSDDIYLFCDFCGSVEHCTVLKERKLYTIMFNTLYEIDIITKQIRFIDIDDLAGALGLYQVDDGLIVHGEMKIVKIDFDLDEIWDFYGADIFVTLQDKPSIIIHNDRIELLDFKNNHYILSHNGKLIKEHKDL